MPNAHKSRSLMNYAGTVPYAIGTLETEIFANPYTNYRRITGAIDIIGFTPAKLITARTYIRIDGVNYRQIDEVVYTVGATDENNPSFDIMTRQNFRVTVQLNIAEAAPVNIPWHGTVEYLY